MSKANLWVHILDESWQLPTLLPDTRRALSFKSWRELLLPAQLSHVMLAYMLLQGHSRAARTAFLPVVLLFLYRSSVTLNVSCLEENTTVCDPALAWRNQGHLLNNFFSALQAITWAVEPRAPKRIDGTSPPLFEFITSFRAMDMEGVGSRCHRPKEWRPTQSRAAFCLATAGSLLINVLAVDILQTYIHYLDQEHYGFGKHGPLLPPDRLPSLRSTYITGVAAIVVYSVIQAVFDVGTLIGVGILRHDPKGWPPLFDKPWLSTSLSDFWGRRWHQIFRLCFIKVTAVLPLLRPLAILAAFALSGLLHLFGGWGMGYGESVARMVGFFVMNGVGILLERAVLKHFFRAQSDGKKRVGGMSEAPYIAH
ncbi:hypothetical protein CYLTODRAFT_488939 [Cylindrobasidium torrendii FP15055 ss-10]|uniref:Wax synthase domain-containing protein n=1 Tax=Cylindrobasidium torrendii FP15055 ss-10 TaxID=1314674 RepID=A0A0D7BG05_9AGAR|nr:hypothetical protein CYLTODRAFT_488939 [Cylindrobasidium torrendii FP15055 ss-10]